jgi:peptidoglycan/LPS O-acetylase OafA/YrhL
MPGVVIEGIAAAVFVGSLMYGRDFRGYTLLDLPVARFYGRISYSFYLLHFFCLFVVAQGLFRLIPGEWLHAYALAFGAFL